MKSGADVEVVMAAKLVLYTVLYLLMLYSLFISNTCKQGQAHTRNLISFMKVKDICCPFSFIRVSTVHYI